MNSPRLWWLAFALLVIAPVAASAAIRQNFSIPSGPLDIAITTLARQGGVSIGSIETGLGNTAITGVHGWLTPGAALKRLLAGTPFRAVAIDGSSFRVTRAAPPRAPVPVAVSASRRIVVRSDSVISVLPPSPEVIVTASKRQATLLRFPGSVVIVRLGEQRRGLATLGIADIAPSVPILQSTGLGSGRDKLFVRGVADSSFTGPTQSTASIYFGDVQLGYNGPDPNLNLYDVDRIEVLEGPQGTLYGAGSIGGVIRLTPHTPELDRFEASAALGATLTQDGMPGYDASAMANLPLLRDKLALRVVGYRSLEGGYVDDRLRRRGNVNRVTTTGARAALRAHLGEGWTVDLGLVGQTIGAPDSQYALNGSGRLGRRSAIAQPFEQDFLLGRAVVEKSWLDGLHLLSAAGIVEHHSDDRFDATRPVTSPLALAYDTHNRNRLLSHETRLSRVTDKGGSWLIGMSLLQDIDAIERLFGPPGREQDIIGVTNRTFTASGFGEATLPLTSRLALTGGGRVTWARTDGDPSATSRNDFIRGRSKLRIDPTLAASWLMAPRLAWFARYQSGFRTGGLAVAPGVGRVANFKSDTIHVAETGVRLERGGKRGVSAAISLSTARWRSIQADLIDRRGFPYTTNIGNGRIDGLELNADWIPVDGLQLLGSAFLNDSRLTDPTAGLASAQNSHLPDTPRLTLNVGATYSWPARRATWRLGGSARYIGHSLLGTGALLDIRQGNYTAADVFASWQRGPLNLSATLENLGNIAGNRFALGNPFGVVDRNQMTPLRPRNLRLGMAYQW